MDGLLKNKFNSDIVVKAIQSCTCMKYVQEGIIDPTELYIFTTGFEKRTVQLGQSKFTYCTRDAVSACEKQFNLVPKKQVNTGPDCDYPTPNSVQGVLR